MIEFTIYNLRLTCAGLLLGVFLLQRAIGADIDITEEVGSFGFLKPVPVHISGFTGEVDAVLRQDLRFMGVVHVPIEEAKYLVSGSNNSRVEGRLVVRGTKEQKFGRAYTGGSLRAQTH